ncbi:hypothetical protein DPEC_G00228650 [Dallia pectoralis]|uniref:Uncharacterized protein n=1 Tax=Dallia pectoralis TaxID=75939 RepID=A0ACC2G1A0_DALPE|nr:hypothetical protein DPEC_G00228650 [Dallia pectoralis]
MTVQLTEGAIEALAKGSEVTNPVLQILNMHYIGAGSGTDRLRLIMSDGLHYMSSFLLATQLNSLYDENHLAPYCVCLLKKFLTNTLKDGRRVVVVLDLEVVKSAGEVGEKIGNPCIYVGEQSMSPQNQNPGPSLSASASPSHTRPREQSMSPQNQNPGPSLSASASPSHPRPRAAPSSTNGPDGQEAPMAPPTTPGGSKAKVVPIASLNPYNTKFTVRVRGEIRATAFNKEVDTFFSLLEAGKVYYITRGTLKPAKKQYSNLKNDYEMTLHSETSIIPCLDVHSLPMVHCDFVPISQLEYQDKDAIIGARVTGFRGLGLSSLFSSTVMVDPDIPEALRLRGWFDKEGYALAGQSVTEFRPGGGGANTCWKTLGDVTTEQLGHGDKADYYSCIATMVFCRKENRVYRACPTADCKKKVVDQLNGLYRCEKCDKEFPNYKHCLILSANIADFSGNQWVTCFQETAERILGHDAESLGQLKDTDKDAFDEVFQKANFTTRIFRNRIKLETFNEEIRLKTTVIDVNLVDHIEYSRRLIGNIREMQKAA